MTRRVGMAIASLLTVVSLSGCASVVGTVSYFLPTADLNTCPVYIGTRNDGRLLGKVCTGEVFDGGPNPLLSVLLFPVVLCDLILSAVMDAIFLPITVPMEIMRPHQAWHSPESRRLR